MFPPVFALCDFSVYLTSSMVGGSHSAMPGNTATSTTAKHIRKNSGSA
jgi:hypothetical protein